MSERLRPFVQLFKQFCANIERIVERMRAEDNCETRERVLTDGEDMEFADIRPKLHGDRRNVCDWGHTLECTTIRSKNLCAYSSYRL